MAKKAKAKKQTYTVRCEWDVTYYCDTTVEATSREEAARIVMDGEPDYDSQEAYDDASSDTWVAGVSEGDGYDSLNDPWDGVPKGMSKDEVTGDCELREAALAVVASWSSGDLAGAVRWLAAALEG